MLNIMEATIEKSQLIGEVQKFIIDNTYGDNNKILQDTLIFKEGYFDSMGFVSLIAFLEETFTIETNSEDLVEENFESINAIVNYVITKKTT